MAQRWERSPPTNVSAPGSIPGRGVICGLNLLLVLFLAPGGFSPGTPVFPSPQKPTFPNSNLIWIIVKHFIMSLWLRWSCKHSLCLALNLHLHFTSLWFFGHHKRLDDCKYGFLHSWKNIKVTDLLCGDIPRWRRQGILVAYKHWHLMVQHRAGAAACGNVAL